ncbi:hypothetical protein CYK66_10205 [Clostridium perfringens]|nr:hypothetical protein CYK66_10205 [Clostridium perfringens]
MGRLHKQKNQKLLIDAFSRIADEFFDYSLEIYGDGELRPELQRQIQSYNLEKRIFLKGTRKNIHSSIYDASLFILSSDYEGLPNALIEAMALGIPCISTDCKPGGAREIINDNEDGLIVKINDAEALSYAIKYVLENSDFADKLSKNALKNISRFDSKVIYNNWSDYMKKLLEVNNEKNKSILITIDSISLILMLVGEICFFKSETIYIYWMLTGCGMVMAILNNINRFSFKFKKDNFVLWLSLMYAMYFSMVYFTCKWESFQLIHFYIDLLKELYFIYCYLLY